MSERIKKLAEQYACITETMTGVETEYIFDLDDLFEFAELIRQDERESCAVIADRYDNGRADNAADLIANEIRQRGDK